jgi:hypothetical protein
MNEIGIIVTELIRALLECVALIGLIVVAAVIVAVTTVAKCGKRVK